MELFHFVCAAFPVLAPRKRRMEKGGGNKEPFSSALQGSHVTLRWMLWDGYVFITY